jgi:F-box-like
MKIGSAINQEAYVHLPTEVLQLIILFVKHENESQHSLWACCLVSRQWYSAAVSSLYEIPSLQGRNFLKFSETICPPVNAHIRRVELAQYVKHLDMSALAYESSNSMTARLLRRVGKNLESFTAPAKSFS